MPVWHDLTEKWVRSGKLTVLGVAEEQHPDRCRLWLQWQKIGWPMMHDPITKMGSSAVPLFTAIDEHGIVRLTQPDPATFEREFVLRLFPAPEEKGHIGSASPPDVTNLLRSARSANSYRAWRDYGDAQALWGGRAGMWAALDAYSRALKLKEEAETLFRLGVVYRMRYDSPDRREGDFQAAVDEWTAALDRDPNQYIWRRRIQQYGPRLTKPYSFYDWVEHARDAIRARGEIPVHLSAEPSGAEMAAPLRAIPAPPVEMDPDPEGRITRDSGKLVGIEAVIVPRHITPGAAVRLHLVLRVNSARRTHWNNEAAPLRIWLNLPAKWAAEHRLIEFPNPLEPTSAEARELSVELKIPEDAPPGNYDIGGHALFNICEDLNGACLFRRHDIHLTVRVTAK